MACYKNYSLKSLEIVKDKKLTAFYLSATYECEDENGSKWSLSIPRIDLNAYLGSSPIMMFGCPDENFINIGFGARPMLRDSDGSFMIFKQIEQQPKEVTLEEIEKALGYSVKIVQNKD